MKKFSIAVNRYGPRLKAVPVACDQTHAIGASRTAQCERLSRWRKVQSLNIFKLPRKLRIARHLERRGQMVLSPWPVGYAAD
jgi:hypothetical protein